MVLKDGFLLAYKPKKESFIIYSYVKINYPFKKSQ